MNRYLGRSLGVTGPNEINCTRPLSSWPQIVYLLFAFVWQEFHIPGTLRLNFRTGFMRKQNFQRVHKLIKRDTRFTIHSSEIKSIFTNKFPEPTLTMLFFLPFDSHRKEADPERRLRGISQWTIIGDYGSIGCREINIAECPHRLPVSSNHNPNLPLCPINNHLFTATEYRNKGVEGSIRIGNRVGRKANKKLCSYILQDDNLFPFFTVLESMTLAARLKIGTKSYTYRQFMVSKTRGGIILQFTSTLSWSLRSTPSWSN